MNLLYKLSESKAFGIIGWSIIASGLLTFAGISYWSAFFN